MLKSILALSALLLLPLGATAQDMPKPVDADDIEWRDAPPILPAGAEMAVIAGDPSKEGPFVVRLKLPENYKIPAHRHPMTEYVTVLSGRFSVGMGDKLDTDNGERLGRGGFIEIPPNMNHYAWTGRGAVIQVHGQGPIAMTYVNPADDPSNRRTSDRLNEVIEHLDAERKRTKDPKAKVLFETASGVIEGLVKSFRRLEKGDDDDDDDASK
jgi:quercetin dioxygenase-like cupin family protein